MCVCILFIQLNKIGKASLSRITLLEYFWPIHIIKSKNSEIATSLEVKLYCISDMHPN